MMQHLKKFILMLNQVRSLSLALKTQITILDLKLTTM